MYVDDPSAQTASVCVGHTCTEERRRPRISLMLNSQSGEKNVLE